MQEVEIDNTYRNAYIRIRCFKGLFTHDISNLFHVISNSLELCEMLIIEGVRKEEILDYFKLLEEQINRGKKLVRNIKNISELEDFGMPLKPIDLFNNLKNAVRFAKINFPRKFIDISIHSEAEGIYVSANDLLLDVFENILMNSIVYNKSERIQIEVIISEVLEFNKQYIKLEFKDNGIGIENKRKIQILQEEPEKSNNSKGMGLGLSFVAKFIDLCEGKIWIEDRIIGDSSKGSNFIIIVPKAIQPDL
jgi:signal transduction histidine kinase